MRPLLPLLLVAACAAPQRQAALSSPTRHTLWAEKQEGKLVVRYGDDVFTELRYADGPFPYLYPVHAAGGVPVTRGYPMDPRDGEASDHPHHRSFWFVHGSVGGADFWHAAAANGGTIDRAGDFEEILHRGKTLEAAYDFEWRGKEGPVLRERRRFTFGVDGDQRWVDVHSSLTPAAEADVTFGDTKEGSFALRMHPGLRLRGDHARGSAVNSEGVTGKDVWGKRAAWVHYQGVVEESSVGVAIFEHPTNFRHPTWWHARDYGLVAANPFGVHDFERKPAGTGDHVLPAGETLELRYRVWIHTGERTAEQVADAFGEYLAQVPVR